MKKALVYLIGGLLVAGTAAGIILAVRNSNSNSGDKNLAASQAGQNVSNQACKIFTLAEAKQVLGPDVKGGNDSNTSSSGDIDISSCSYSEVGSGEVPVSQAKTASLTVRASKTDSGTATNANQFSQLRPADAQDVSGYGDSAYWDPKFGQLNVLKSDNWYVLTNGPITPSQRTLDEAQDLADLIIGKL